MALQNILDAIVSEADVQITTALSQHRQKMKELRENSEKLMTQKHHAIASLKDMKIRQLREKATSRALILRSRALLSKKQEHMDALYTKVMDMLTALPEATTTAFLQQCFSHVRGTGVVMPTKAHKELCEKLMPSGCTLGKTIDGKGGFRFSSDKAEYDFTYEFIVQSLLRPMTDVQAAHGLFSAL